MGHGEVLEGTVVSRRHADGRVEIVSAPPIACMSLEFLAEADRAVTVFRGREVTFAGQVTYRVTGWDDVQSCLVLERIGGGV